MAWNPSPKVADAREIARKWGNKQMVIIISIDHNGKDESVSYGDTVQSCKVANIFMQTAMKAIGLFIKGYLEDKRP